MSARAGVSSCRGANTSGASTGSARAGTFDTCHDGTRAACASAKVRELTEPTLLLNAAYLGADVSHGSMPVSTPNTSARREAQVSFQEPSDLTTEQRTANMMAAGVFKRGTIPPTVVKLQDEDDCADDLQVPAKKVSEEARKKIQD